MHRTIRVHVFHILTGPMLFSATLAADDILPCSSPSCANLNLMILPRVVPRYSEKPHSSTVSI